MGYQDGDGDDWDDEKDFGPESDCCVDCGEELDEDVGWTYTIFGEPVHYGCEGSE